MTHHTVTVEAVRAIPQNEDGVNAAGSTPMTHLTVTEALQNGVTYVSQILTLPQPAQRRVT